MLFGKRRIKIIELQEKFWKITFKCKNSKYIFIYSIQVIENLKRVVTVYRKELLNAICDDNYFKVNSPALSVHFLPILSKEKKGFSSCEKMKLLI